MKLDVGDILYSIGERVEKVAKRTAGVMKMMLKPIPSARPPKSWPIQKQWMTPHEVTSLLLQLIFLGYLVTGVVVAYLGYFLALIILSAFYFLVLRFILVRYSDYILDFEAYRVFYLVVSTIAFVSYVGYVLLRRLSLDAYWYYAYLGVIGLVVILFRHYFKSRYGRDYTYGVVEEVKNDLVKVFVHDDMAANVKPGYYWVPAVPDAEPGVVVKLLVEERVFRSSRPIRILEVYLDTQSSQTETEPKDETE
ncbi:hypothetical membrane protein, conserved [Thermococcus kodakarensis KOD1]|uniref:Hypothetical membrane protein, conserved n=1 Tax=Thermococcus kodakarensis (strain ATCC BAA-918 / JCM 12380 / KOD1) TaxID=69014 RepID=Q5JIV8_THEKO|nr:hypothetical membrane protein, conserved [Thermococcus kodakarensis KOD1]